MAFAVLLLLTALKLVAGACPPQGCTGKRVICYFTNWAARRPGDGSVAPNKIDPCLCTNVMYAFAEWSNYRMVPFETYDIDFFRQMNDWRTTNPVIRISLSIGGWPTSTGPRAASEFGAMVDSPANRKVFIDSLISYLRQYGLDGVDLDWEYPGGYQRSSYASLVEEMRVAFNNDEAQTGRSRLLLTAAVPPDTGRMAAYDWGRVKDKFDWMTIMTYDMHGGWDGNWLHHSGFAESQAAVNSYLNNGVPASKLALGIASYGRATAPAGAYTRETGFLAYYEVCEKRCKSAWQVTDVSGGPRASGSGGYVNFDTVNSLRAKAQYINNQGLAGASLWAIDMDDITGKFCCQGTFPLTKAVKGVLQCMSEYSAITDTDCSCFGTATSSATSQGTTAAASTGTVNTGIVTTTMGSPLTVTQSQPCGSYTRDSDLPVSVLQEVCNKRSDVSKDFIRHPMHCGKFIRCAATPDAVECASGLVFDTVCTCCNWPQNAQCIEPGLQSIINCGGSAATTPAATTSPVTTKMVTAASTTTTTKTVATTTSTKPTTTTTTTTTQTPTTTDTRSCDPTRRCTNVAKIADPNDCSKYTNCNTIGQLEECKKCALAGIKLYFDVTTGSCRPPSVYSVWNGCVMT